MTTIDWLHKLRESGLTDAQAEAIASLPEQRYVTREYLDSRLQTFEQYLDARFAQTDARIASAVNDLTWRMLGVAGLAIVIIGLLDKFVRP